MTPEAQRIAIAEAFPKIFDCIDSGVTWAASRDDHDGEPVDPLNDRNAIHEAEQATWAKDWSLRDVFVDHLARIINPTHGYRMQGASDLLDATTAQRAQALLLTLDLYYDTK